jgi:hypothetical protein
MDWKASIKGVKMLDLSRFSTFQRTPSIILGEFRMKDKRPSQNVHTNLALTS